MVKGLKLINILSLAAAISAILLAILALSTLMLTLSSIQFKSFEVGGEVSELTIKAKLELENRGIMNVAIPLITTTVKDYSGEIIGRGESRRIDISPGSRIVIDVPLSINLREEKIRDFLFEDQELEVNIEFRSAVEPLVSLIADARLSFYWGAPLYGFKLGKPTIIPINSTHIALLIPLSFQNKNQYVPIDALVKISILDEEGLKVGEGEVVLRVPPNSSFADKAELSMRLPEMREELLFSDTTLDYKIVMSVEVDGESVATLVRDEKYQWGAPLKKLEMGEPALKLYNETHLIFSVPISFINNNEYLEVEELFYVYISNAETGRRLGSGIVRVDVRPKSPFEGEAKGFMKLPITPEELLIEGAITKLRVEFSGEVYGSEIKLERVMTHRFDPLISDISVVKPSITPLNMTHSRITIPIRIEMAAGDISLNAEIYGELVTSGNLIATTTTQALELRPGSITELSLIADVKNEEVEKGDLRVRIVISTQFGEIIQEVDIF